MRPEQDKNASTLSGWVMAIAIGLAAFVVALLVARLPVLAAVAIGIVAALLAWLATGMNRANKPGLPPATAIPGGGPALQALTPPPAAATTASAAVAPPAPVASAPTASAAMSAGTVARRPEPLAAARGGKADDLKIIKGIGPKLEILCHTLGFFHFDQVAAWQDDEIAWVDQNLEGFKGRVTRDRWVPQARAIVSMGPAEFLRRLDAGEEF